MATLEELLAQQAAMRGTQPKYSARCETCKDSKRTHRRGWINCTKKGCSCERYVNDYAARGAWSKKTYQPWLDKWYALCDEVNNARSAEEAPARAEREARYAKDSAERAAAARRAQAVDVRHYPSFTAFVAACQETPLHPTNRAAWQGILAGDLGTNLSWEWTLGDDTDAPHRLADLGRWLLAGWPRGVAMMREGLGHIELPQLSDVRRRGRWGDVGDVLSHDRLYSGNVDRCWRSTHRARAGAPPRLQIIVHATMNAGVSANEGFWRGAAATALADAAQAAGYAVAIDTLQCAHGYTRSGANYIVSTRAKDYDVPTNAATLAALTAHPSLLRVFTFALQDVIASDEVAHGMRGYAYEPPVEELAERGLLDAKSVLLIVPQNCTSLQRAKAWIAEQAARLETMATGEGAAA